MRRAFGLLAGLALIAAGAPAEAASPLGQKLESLAGQGSAEAAYHLGMLHHLGLEGFAKDTKKAFELFRRAADQGDPLAAYKVGCYYAGQGEGAVEPDAALAEKYKRIAAEAGYATAQVDLGGLLLRRGDIADGIRWHEAAAAQGHMAGLAGLMVIYSGAVAGVPKDPLKSFTYLHLLARRGGGGAEPPPPPAQLKESLGAGLTPAQFEEIRATASQWQARPTAVTERADAGLNAARQLAGLPPGS